MALKKLFLHLGPHKTASTSLQELFASNREQLKGSGIFVPITDGPHAGQHFPILRELVQNEEELDDISFFEGMLSLREVKEELNSTGLPTLLLSSEGFANREVNWVARLIDSLNPKEVELLFTLREPTAWVSSIQSQKLISGRWNESSYSGKFLDNVVEVVLPRLYSNILEVVQSGLARLTLINMSPQEKFSIEGNYSEALGLDTELPKIPPLNSRPAPCVLRLLGASHDLLGSKNLERRLIGHFNYYLSPHITELLGTHSCGVGCSEKVEDAKSASVEMAVREWHAKLNSIATRVIGEPVTGQLDKFPSGIFLIPEPSKDDRILIENRLPVAYKDLMEAAINIWDELQSLKKIQS